MIPTSNVSDLSSPLPQSQNNDARRIKRRRVEQGGNPEREVGLMRTGLDQSKPRFIGSGSGIHFIRTVYDLLAGKSYSTSAFPSTATPGSGNIVPGEDDQLHESADSHLLTSSPPFFQESEVQNTPARGSDPISFHQLVELSENYFTNWHPAFPFLHAPAVLGVFETISRHGIEATAPSAILIVRSIMSISLADSRQSTKRLPPVPRRLIFYNNAELSSTFQFTMALPATLENLQTTISLQLFLISMMKFNYASRLGGLSVRMAYALGCHRCPARFDNFTPAESQLRRRVFWSLYCIERMVSQSLGLPLDLRDDDIDVCYPGEERHARTGNDQLPLEDINASQLRLLTELSKHARIRGRILELRNKALSGREETFERAMEIQADLAKWMNEIDKEDEDSSEAEESPSLSPESAANHLPLGQHLFSVCASKLHQRIEGNRFSIEVVSTPECSARWFAHSESAHVLATFYMVYVDELFCAGAYAALEGHSKLGTARKYARETLLILNHLSLRQTVWPDSCADAVKQVVHALNRSHETSTAVVVSSGPNPASLTPHPHHVTGLQQGNRAWFETTHRLFTPSEAHHDEPRNHADINRSDNSGNCFQRRMPLIPVSSPRLFTAQQTSTTSRTDMPERLAGNEWDQPDLNQGEFFDPLIAMDFSNFAPGTTDPSRPFGLH